MLKTALFDCAINEKCCSVDGGRGICPLFSSPLWGIWQLKSPQPGNLLSKAKKMLMLGGQPGGGGGGVGGTKCLRALASWIVLFSQKGAWSWKFLQYIACARLSFSVDGRKKRTGSERNAAKKRRFLSPLLTRFFALFLFGSVFTIFLVAWNRLHNANQRSHSCNADTLSFNAGRPCHGRKFRKWVWFARFWDPKVSYCYTNGFLFHFGGSFLILWANWILSNLRFVS